MVYQNRLLRNFPGQTFTRHGGGQGNRNLAVEDDRGVPGTISLFESPHQSLQPGIVCFLSQWDFGTPEQVHRNIPPYKDTRENRIIWFRQCLEQLKNLNIKSVGIPYKIGCGLGGGEWTNIFQLYKRVCRII